MPALPVALSVSFAYVFYAPECRLCDTGSVGIPAGFLSPDSPAHAVIRKGITMDDGLSMFVMLIAGAVGSGLVIYGIRQKEPVSLGFGVAISVVPWMLPGGLAAIASVALIGMFMAMRKML